MYQPPEQNVQVADPMLSSFYYQMPSYAPPTYHMQNFHMYHQYNYMPTPLEYQHQPFVDPQSV